MKRRALRARVAGFRARAIASCSDPGCGQTVLAEGVAADAGFYADVDLDVALGAGFGEAAGFGLFDFHFELALRAELFGADGVGAVDRALGMNAVAGEGRFAADGAEFANGLRSNDRFWFEDAHMAPIWVCWWQTVSVGRRWRGSRADGTIWLGGSLALPASLALSLSTSHLLLPLLYQIWVGRVFERFHGAFVTQCCKRRTP